MPWNLGVFQRTDGTRTGTTVWTQAEGAGVGIEAADHDVHDQDLADGIQQCLRKDGGNAATGNIPMNGYRLTGMGDATNAQDAVNRQTADKRHQENSATYAAATGLENAYEISLAPAVTAYVAGHAFMFKANAANTGAATLNVNTVGAKSIVREDGADLLAGDIAADAIILVVYHPTDDEFRIIGGRKSGYGVGQFSFWTMKTPPAGWLVADGREVSRTTYAALNALYAADGYPYGDGDGSTTFNLPNGEGEFIRGWDGDRGIDEDRVFGSTQLDAFQGHWHQLVYSDLTGSVAGSDVHRFNNQSASLPAGQIGNATPDGVNGTPRTASETRPRNLALLACVYAGV